MSFARARRDGAGVHYVTMVSFLMHEAFYNNNSFWGPYIRLLPKSFESTPQQYGAADRKLLEVGRQRACQRQRARVTK